MGSYHTKEDDVAKISTSIYITNFPESLSAKELFHACKQYGNVSSLRKDLRMVAIGNEGFAGIKIKYMGELWVMMEFNSKETLHKFRESVSIASWFSQIKEATIDFEAEDVDDQEENCYHSKRICIYMKFGRSVVDEFKIIHQGKIYWIRANETPGWVPDFTDDSDDDDQDEINTNEDCTDNHNLGGVSNDNLNDGAGNDSDVEGVPDTLFEEEGMAKKQVEGAKLDINGDNSEDPFNLYLLLNKNRATNGSENKSGSIKYPPGFTHTNTGKDENSTYVVEEKNCYRDEVNNGNMEEINDAASGSRMHNSAKEVRNDSSSSGHFKKSEIPRIGGSILGLLEEVVKVGQVMGYNMERCLVEVTLGGSHFTWCHKSAKKMSKLDRFLVSENLLSSCQHLNAITLERYLSDHHPILLRENHYDYGPTPFCFFHHWIEMKGFCKLVEDTWKDSPSEGFNAMKILMAQYKKDLEAVDLIIDSEQGVEEDIRNRSNIIHKIQDCDKIDSLETVQKAKVKWVVEGDENSKFFHGMLNKKRSILNFQGVLVDGVWVDSPNSVKKEFFDHFSNRFCKPGERRATIHMEFPNQLHSDQCRDLEIEVTNEEIKRAVWECGTDKAQGPDGFTFGFFRHFWYLVEQDVYEAVRYFFIHKDIPKGCNSSFIALIPKIPDANLVKDFRPITLIGSIYKIIAKILTNRLVGVLGGIVNEVQSAFVTDRQILDGLFILNEVSQWCKTKKKQALIFKTWNDIVDRVRRRLSKWKMKTLSVGGRLTLVKSVLGSIPIFHMSIFKVPSGILRTLESIRSRFFNGHEISSKKAIHGADDSICADLRGGNKSCWMSIVNEIKILSKKGINLMNYLCISVGNGESTLLWDDVWREGGKLKDRFPRVYALESGKSISVGTKFAQPSFHHSFRCPPRGGVKQMQYDEFVNLMQQVILAPISDR
uniref:RNA-directed DNA polymerase, eukaryota, reverse transcriptase zinc-binding domain protein n=1 Tax=Tanacetum cinerariifolium TaxID=118510 RepID=A0A6L2LRR8_TANCI|nr:RNA-directed DNA polymerase, eukaryota, reverse transcriptase zinc-binding domain protein [Tanacetum cinerariifolium]